MIAKRFIELYNSFYGAKVDNLQQIHVHNFKGEELFDFVKYVEQANEAKTSNESDMLCFSGDTCDFMEDEGRCVCDTFCKYQKQS